MCKIVRTIFFGYWLFCWHIHTETPVLCVHVGCSYLLVCSYVLKLRHSKLSAGCSFQHFSHNPLMISCLQTHVKPQEVLNKSRTFLPLLDTSAEMLFYEIYFNKNPTSICGMVRGLDTASGVICYSLSVTTTLRRLPS
jgi:hypothetical protein